jgi:glycosyltransferase involved in cell wall biosynthesis
MNKRISLVINSLVQGGAQKSLILLARELKDAGHEVQILTFYPEETDFFELPTGIEVVRLTNPFKVRSGFKKRYFLARKLQRLYLRLQDLKEARSAFQRFDPALILAFESSTSVIAYFASIQLCPILISERVHPKYHEIPYWAKVLRPLVYRSKRSHLHCQGEDISKWMQERYKKEVKVIPNFLNEHAQNLWNPNSIKIKVFSRYSHQKGIDLAIAAWSKLPRHLQRSYKLEIFGDGERGNYLNQIEALNLSHCIELKSATKTVSLELTDCLIFLLPSRFEGFPNSLAEAICAGIPSISTDCPSAVRELTCNGKLAHLVELNPDGIADGLKLLLEDPNLRGDYHNKSPKIFEEFDSRAILNQWSNYIYFILEEH